MKPGRENAAGIHIGAGLSGYVAEMTSAFVCAALGIEPSVRHADYLGSWMKLCSPRHNFINHEVTIM
jgi:antirestriction protein ArdC